MVGIHDLVGSHELLSADEAQRAAMEYISRGWAVTAGPGLDALGVCACRGGKRCRNPGKHAYKGWGNEERRTLTAEQAERYWSPKNSLWQNRPVDQVFIVPYLSGLIVADVDSMEAWDALPGAKPETLHQSSGSGRGGHYLYNFDWDISEGLPPTVAGKLGGGAGEIKFRGIITAAPSVHTSGGRYRWENWGTEIADAPEWIVTPPAKYGGVERDWDSIVNAGPEDEWTNLMFVADVSALDSFGDVRSSRPLVMFAIAASMAKWIAAGRINEEFVVDKLLQAGALNGSIDRYGEVELTRQIKNGIRTGMMEKRN